MPRILLLLFTCSLLTPPAAAESRVAMGYFVSFVEQDIEKLPWRQLTHLCHAFLTTDENGEPVTGDVMPNKALVEAAHKSGVKVLLSLGGGRTSTGLERVTKDRAAVVAYVKKVVKIVADTGYDGVEVHWEFPRSRETRAGFVSLVAALRAGLDAEAKKSERPEPYLLTAAVSPSGFFGKWIDVGAVVGRLDWLNVMAYDMSGPWDKSAGHNSPLFPSPKDPDRSWRSVTQAMAYWSEDRGVPKEKLVLGVPLYGRALPVDEPYVELDPAKKELHGVLGFTEIRDLIGKGWPAEWDPVSQAPWLRTPDGKRMIIAYDDRNSIDKKSRWAAEQGYRGLAYWAIHQDRMADGTHWLLRASARAWPVEK